MATKYQFLTRIQNAQKRLETIDESIYCINEPKPNEKLHRIGYQPKVSIESNRTNTFVEQKDEKGLVRKRIVFENLTKEQLSIEDLEYDIQGRVIHSRTKGNYWQSEEVVMRVGDINITHTLKQKGDIFGEDDEYIVMIDNQKDCVVATYSYQTGRLINIKQIFVEQDLFCDIDFLEDGRILEFRKEKIE